MYPKANEPQKEFYLNLTCLKIVLRIASKYTYMIRLALAGCGWAGERHYGAIQSTDGAELVAIADSDPSTRARRGAEWDVDRAYDDYRAMIRREDFDAIVIALPHHLHEAAAVAAARNGIHILCEKPIARTLREADTMLDAISRTDGTLIVAESARYQPWVENVESCLADGKIGQPVFLEYNRLQHYGGAYGYDRSDWLNDPQKLGGGPWLLNGIHNVSVLRGFAGVTNSGDVERVFLREFRTPTFEAPAGMEASVRATLAFENGSTAAIKLGVETPHHDQFNDVRIHGTEGTLVVDHDKTRLTLFAADTDPVAIDVNADVDQYERQMNAFIDTVVAGADSRSPGLRERNTLAIVRAGYESRETGEAITPSYRTG